MKATLFALLPLAAVVAATDDWSPEVAEDCEETTSAELAVPTIPVAVSVPAVSPLSAISPISVSAGQGQKWTTSIVYATQFHTITSCGPEVTNCPAHSTIETTIIIPVSTTICPVTETEAAVASPSASGKSIVSPILPAVSTSVALPAASGSFRAIPSVSPSKSSVYINPVSSVPAGAPTFVPTSTLKSIITNGAIGTVTAPAKTSSTYAVVTAGAAQNIQLAGGALAAVALAAALI